MTRTVIKQAIRYGVPSLLLLGTILLTWLNIGMDRTQPDHEGNYGAFFGDLHVHTKLSADAFVFGARTSIEDAYRFAQGEEITLFDGRTVRIGRPLDFVAITDHSESFGEYYVCTTPSHPRYSNQWCERARSGDTSAWAEYSITGRDGFREKSNGVCESDAACRQEADTIWQRIVATAEEHYQPGSFTTFPGFEFSPSIPTGGMLHRNVIFSSEAVPDHALSATEADTELDLWAWLDQTCNDECDAITIPHNMNFSSGFTFARETTDKRPYSEQDQQRQGRIERLVEIAQVKGYSECVSGLGLTDEECGVEAVIPLCTDTLTRGCVPYGGDARTGLAQGLRDLASGKGSSLKPGFIGSTDNHNGLAGNTQEDNYAGAVGILDSTPGKRVAENLEDWPEDGEPQALRFWKNTKVKPFRRNPGGLAGVWATQNTREALFEAFQQARTFATSGNRMAVRFAAGEQLPESKDVIEQAFANASAHSSIFPMGASIPRGQLQALRMKIEAHADPLGPGLHEIQVVKAWADPGGSEKFRIYSVFCDGQPISAQVSENNETVCSAQDFEPDDHCAISDEGPRKAVISWRDPDFQAETPAYYYIRVFERPTCRWTTYQALESGLPTPKSVPRTIRERAWSSPIYLD